MPKSDPAGAEAVTFAIIRQLEAVVQAAPDRVVFDVIDVGTRLPIGESSDEVVLACWRLGFDIAELAGGRAS